MSQVDWIHEPPFVRASETSRAAATAIKPVTPTLRALVFEAIRAKPSTDEEVQEKLAMSPNTQRPRRIELAKAGLIVKSGLRQTRSKRWADVWAVRP